MTDKLVQFYVEGPDWKHEVQVDSEIFETEKDLYVEAASQGIERQIRDKSVEKLNLGPIVIVRRGRAKKEAMVNAFICLNNISQFEIANKLRENYKKQSDGQDLAVDEVGYSF